MRVVHRKTAPRVKQGKVQRKNRWTLTPNCHSDRAEPIVERHKPGYGYRHVLRKEEVERFTSLLPDWNELSRALNSIVLAAGRTNCDGWYSPGVVAICAWDRELRFEVDSDWHQSHRSVLEQIGVACTPTEEGDVFCHWTESTIRAYQLTHVLLHELGHHHDRITTRSQRRCSRGEGYAERYAIQYASLIWNRYLDEFGLP